MDSSHLEKMGRELKCPICLSLLNSAVSLTCNHVFCNLCIEKSMKTASNCPVCKVPYHRREVRPAPHMDNLVSIYKSMEVASGANIFLTQTVSEKVSGGENQPEADTICEMDKLCNRSVDPHKQRKLKGKKPKGSSKSTQESSGSGLVRPSFPTKKRVQVPQRPLPETPQQETRLGERTENEPWKSSVVQEGMPVLNNKKNQELCPFFWLQEEEEDGDKCTPLTNYDPVVEDTPPDVPSFSDIKDSDDERECNINDQNGPIALENADLFDSEMFEWTQRACSPELCSSPMKIQVEETDQCNDIGGTEEKTAGNNTINNMDEEPCSRKDTASEARADKMVVDVLAPTSLGSKYIGKEGNATIPKKRIENSSDRNQNKRAKRSKTFYMDSTDMADDNTHEGKLDKLDKRRKSSRLKGKTNKRVKKDTQYPSAAVPMLKNKSTLTEGAKSLDQSCRSMVVDSPASSNGKDGISGSQDTKKESESNSNKRGRRSIGVYIDPKDLVEGNNQHEKHDNISNRSTKRNLKVRGNKTENNVCQDPCATKMLPENVSNLAEGTKHMKQDKELMLVVDLSGSLGDKEDITGYQSLKNNGKRRISSDQQQEGCGRRLNPRKLNTVSDLGAKTRETGSAGSVMDSESGKKLKHPKKVKFSTVESSMSTPPNDIQENPAKETKPCEEIQGNSGVSKMEKACPISDGILRRCEKNVKKFQCSFCQSAEDSEASGHMVHYLRGKPVTVDYDGGNVVHVHKSCAEWAPNVYFEDDIAINLEAELTRSKRIKCGCCGLKGAALGCYEKSCRRSFHIPCAKLTPQCRWDNDNFVMLCPLHASSKLPNEISGFQAKQKEKSPRRRQQPINPPKVVAKHDDVTSFRWNCHGLSGKLVLCCSALTIPEKETVSEFERLSGVPVLKNWDSSVTHVIASTDENRACRRTLKFLMGILEGKWVLSIEWIKACLKAKEHVDEQPYEIEIDGHGVRNGPRQGRLRILNKQPKLFDGYKFYFAGDFQPSYKGYLGDLVIAAGGTVLHRKPVSEDDASSSSTFVIYSLELPDKCKSNNKDMILQRRRFDAETIASSCDVEVASNSWILDSIAACRL